jgi:hypothetical protein
MGKKIRNQKEGRHGGADKSAVTVTATVRTDCPDWNSVDELARATGTLLSLFFLPFVTL